MSEYTASAKVYVCTYVCRKEGRCVCVGGSWNSECVSECVSE